MGLRSWTATVAVTNNWETWRQIISDPIPHVTNNIFTIPCFCFMVSRLCFTGSRPLCNSFQGAGK